MTPYIQSYQQLQAYILRRLGSPVINVELSTDQLADIIDETLATYTQIAYSGSQLMVGTLPVVQGQNVYNMDFSVAAVIYIFNPLGFGMLGDLSSPTSVFQVSDYLAQNFLNQGYFSGGMMLSYSLFQQFAETFDMKFSPKIAFDYNQTTKQLVLEDSPHANQNFGMIYYQYVDPTSTEYPNMAYLYDDIFVKKLSVAIAKKQWGQNLLKYSGSPMPSGLQLNGEKIYQEGKDDYEKLMDELYSRYVLPSDFFVG